MAARKLQKKAQMQKGLGPFPLSASISSPVSRLMFVFIRTRPPPTSKGRLLRAVPLPHCWPLDGSIMGWRTTFRTVARETSGLPGPGR